LIHLFRSFKKLLLESKEGRVFVFDNMASYSIFSKKNFQKVYVPGN